MILKDSLLKQFVELTNDSTSNNENKYLYGTVKIINDRKYISLDGSNVLTPISTVAKVKDGERVLTTIENHTAIVMGNLSSPSASDKDLLEVNEKVIETGKMLAHKVISDELDVINGIIDNLQSKIANIENADIVIADIERLKAKYSELDYVSANELKALNADIDSIKAKIGEFDSISTEDLDAINAEIENLKGKNAEFDYVSAETFKALKGIIENLKVGNLEATYAKIDLSNVGTEYVDNLFVKSGVFEKVTGEEGILYELTSVRFNGDLIKVNTVVADSLILTGLDGLYYRMNAEGGHLTQEQLSNEIYQKYLDGTNIVANSVTADKMNVNKLSSLTSDLGDITGGSLNINNKFIVDNLGNMKSVNGEFSGKIDALSGSIGGFSIENNSLEVDILKTIDGTLNRKQFILDASKNVIFFRSYRPASDIEYGPSEEIRISHKGFEMESGTYGGKIDYYVSLDYESLGFDGDMCNASYGVNGIDIYDNSDIEAGLKSTTIDDMVILEPMADYILVEKQVQLMEKLVEH